MVAKGTVHRGAITVLMAVMLVLFLAAALFAIDVSYINMVCLEMRTVADFAARAGAEAISNGRSTGEARDIIKKIALENKVAGVPMILEDSDIVFGSTTLTPSGRYTFQPNVKPNTAVRVTTRRTSKSKSGSVALFIGNLFGRSDFEPVKSATAAGSPRDVAVVVDRSGSMRTSDAGPPGGPSMTRIDALKRAVRQFRSAIDQTTDSEQLGLISFSDTARIDADVATDYALFDSRTAALSTGGGTNLSAGIDLAVTMLTGKTRNEASPVIILMTDGQWTTGRNPRLAASDAIARIPKLTIHTVTFSKDANKADMIAVASVGRGQHYHADDVVDLTSTFQILAGMSKVMLIE